MSLRAGYNDEAQRCMRDLDVTGYRRLWRHIAPHLPQPADDAQALAMLHHARTQSASSMTLKDRIYSHRWLVDHGLPSGMPDRLLPLAERLYPVVKEMVGISVNYSARWLNGAADEIRDTMEVEVLDAFATDKKVDHLKLRAHLNDTRARTARRLIGATIPTA